MGSSYFGEPHMGNERASSSSSSSRKGGRKSSSDKPKQPQRGLGVAQLEKIRLHSQLGCGYLPNSLQSPPNYPASLSQEDMRLQTAYSPSSSLSYSSPSSSSYGLQGHQSIMMGLGELERANIRYGDSPPSSNTRWNPGNTILEAQHFAQPGITRPLLNQEVEYLQEKKKRKDQRKSMGSSSQNSESSGDQELDLELRLSL